MQLSGDPLQYLEKTLTMLEDKIMRLGVGLQEYYCVCAIIGLIKSPSPEQSRNEQMKSADRVTAMIQRVLAAQDNYSAAATLASLPNMVHLLFTSSPTALTICHPSSQSKPPTGYKTGTASFNLCPLHNTPYPRHNPYQIHNP